MDMSKDRVAGIFSGYYVGAFLPATSATFIT